MWIVFEYFDSWRMHININIECLLDVFFKIEATTSSQQRMGMVLNSLQDFTYPSLLTISNILKEMYTIRSKRTLNLILPLSKLGKDPFKTIITSSAPSFNSSELSKYPRRRTFFFRLLKMVKFWFEGSATMISTKLSMAILSNSSAYPAGRTLSALRRRS